MRKVGKRMDDPPRLHISGEWQPSTCRITESEPDWRDPLTTLVIMGQRRRFRGQHCFVVIPNNYNKQNIREHTQTSLLSLILLPNVVDLSTMCQST